MNIAQSSPTHTAGGRAICASRVDRSSRSSASTPPGRRARAQATSAASSRACGVDVAEGVAGRHDGVGLGQRIVGQREHAVLDRIRRVGAGDVEHGGRRIGGDHAVTGIGEVLGEQAAPAADLEHQAVALADRREVGEDPGRARVGVEAEPLVVDLGERGPVVGVVGAATLVSLRRSGARRRRRRGRPARTARRAGGPPGRRSRRAPWRRSCARPPRTRRRRSRRR